MLNRSHRIITVAAALVALGMGTAARAGAPSAQSDAEAPAAVDATRKTRNANEIPKPTLITLDMQNADVGAIFTEIARQSGYDIRPWNLSDWDKISRPRISVIADKQPFWEVFRNTCKHAGMDLVETYDNGGVFMLTPAGDSGEGIMGEPVEIKGPFLFSIRSIHRSSMIGLAHPKTYQRNLWAKLVVMVEPKVNVLSYAARVDEAVDNKGNSLLVATKDDRKGNAVMMRSEGLYLTGGLPLEYLDAATAGNQISTLRGTIHVTAQVQSKTLEVSDLLNANNLVLNIGDAKMTIKSVKQQSRERYVIDAVLTRGKMDVKMFRQLVESRAMRLLDSKGRMYRYDGRGGGGTNDSQSMEIYFTNRSRDNSVILGAPVKLVWDVPTELKEIDVPFTFTNLPLP